MAVNVLLYWYWQKYQREAKYIFFWSAIVCKREHTSSFIWLSDFQCMLVINKRLELSQCFYVLILQRWSNCLLNSYKFCLDQSKINRKKFIILSLWNMQVVLIKLLIYSLRNVDYVENHFLPSRNFLLSLWPLWHVAWWPWPIARNT